MSGPFANALADAHRDEMQGSLEYRFGDERHEADVALYFDRYEAEGASGAWFESWLDGPLLDLGAGVGRHALHFQERFETVAVERSERLVETMGERGVEDARVADLFALRESFGRDRFRSALAVGTQVGLCGSLTGLRAFLSDLAFVTDPGGTAVFDGFDPSHDRTREMDGYRSDPAPGLAHRVIQFEYDGTLGEPWCYRLFTPDRIREAVVGTGWRVADVRHGEGDWEHVYHVALRQRDGGGD